MEKPLLYVEIPNRPKKWIPVNGLLQFRSGPDVRIVRIQVELDPHRGMIRQHQERQNLPMLPAPETEVVTEIDHIPEVVSVFDRPIASLGFSSSTLILLYALGIAKVCDLIRKTEKQLATDLKKLTRGRKGQTKIDPLDILADIHRKVSEAGLTFTSIDGEASSVLIVDPALLELPPTEPVDDLAAAILLGDRFPLFQRVRNGSPEEKIEARNTIVTKNLGLSFKSANFYFFMANMEIDDPMLTLDDLVQEACIGQLNGTLKYDYTRGYAYSTYAIWWIRQAITRAIADATVLPVHVYTSIAKVLKATSTVRRSLAERGESREPTLEEVAQEAKLVPKKVEWTLAQIQFRRHFQSLDEPQDKDDADGDGLLRLVVGYEPDPEEVLDRQLMERTVDRMVSESPLDDVDRQCLILYFGLRGYRPHSLDEAGAYFGVTRERIRQRIDRALKSLCNAENWAYAHEHIRTLNMPSSDPRFVTDIGEKATAIKHRKKPKSEIAQETLARVAADHVLDPSALVGPDLSEELKSFQGEAIVRMHKASDLSFASIAEMLGLSSDEAFRAYILFEELPKALPILEEIASLYGTIAETLRKGVLLPEQYYPVRRTAIGRLRQDAKIGFASIAVILDFPIGEVKLQWRVFETEKALFKQEKRGRKR